MRLIRIFALVLLVSPAFLAPLAIPAEDLPGPHVVSGTLVKLDLDTLRGQLTMDFGKPVFFDVPKAYLFENVTLGARITLELDEQGRAMKVMDTSLPDIVPAPAALIQPVASESLVR